MAHNKLIEIIRQKSAPLQTLPTTLEFRSSLPNKPQVILFDVYGTLFISGSGDIGSLKVAEDRILLIRNLLESFDLNFPAAELPVKLEETIGRIHQQMKNNGVSYPEVEIETVWSFIFNDLHGPKLREFALHYELLVNPVFPMPALAETISYLREMKILMGLISNAQFYTQYLFEAFLGRRLTDLGFTGELLFYSYQSGVAKPDPGMFLRAAEILAAMGKKSSEVLYVGNDMVKDVLPASMAGFMTALFGGDRRSLRMREGDQRVAGLEPDAVITRLDQLKKLL